MKKKAHDFKVYCLFEYNEKNKSRNTEIEMQEAFVNYAY